MHFVSIAVLLYQAVIFSIIIAASVISGRTACVISTLLLCMWTLTHVFFPPLMVLQFIVIVISFIIGMSVSGVTKESNKYSQVMLSNNNESTRHDVETNHYDMMYKNDKYVAKLSNLNNKRCYMDGKIVYVSTNNVLNYNIIAYVIMLIVLMFLLNYYFYKN